MTTIHMAVVEYGSDYGDIEPATILAVDGQALNRALLSVFKSFNYQGNDGEDYEKENPLEGVTAETFGDWYQGFHEHSTGPWINHYDPLDTDRIAESPDGYVFATES